MDVRRSRYAFLDPHPALKASLAGALIPPAPDGDD
jgi:hypothetical protein